MGSELPFALRSAAENEMTEVQQGQIRINLQGIVTVKNRPITCYGYLCTYALKCGLGYYIIIAI